MSLGFVNAPSLGSGIRDAEFGCGAVKAGQSASASGVIQVFRTEQRTLPATVFNSASTPYHQIGRVDSGTWSVNVLDTPQRFLEYRPYETVGPSGIPDGRRTATFELMLDNVTNDDNRILTIDAYNSTSGQILSRGIGYSPGKCSARPFNTRISHFHSTPHWGTRSEPYVLLGWFLCAAVVGNRA